MLRFDDGLTTLPTAPSNARNIFTLKPSQAASTAPTTSFAATKSPNPTKSKIHGNLATKKSQTAAPATAAAAPTPDENKPKSNRQLKAELKSKQWADRLVEKAKTDPKPVASADEEVDFLQRKRQREREAAGSGLAAGKRRKMAPGNRHAFPLLNGAPLPRVMTATTPKGTVAVKEELVVGKELPVDENTRPHGAQLKSQAFKLRAQREKLPIWEHQDALRQCLHDRDVLVMLGQTGSGKSTQIGQFFYDQPWMQRRKARLASGKEITIGGCIAITQPRRVAAINLAKRVATEMGVRIGDEVGYSVRFQNMTSEKTRIKFLTDGMLLQEMLADPLLKKYSVVVVDEAHERTVGTDLVMGFLRGLIYGERRGSLKVVIMSATLEVEKMAKFFEENRGEGLLPPVEDVVDDSKVDVDGEENKEGAADKVSGDPEEDKKSKKKKKKKTKKGQYNPADLIRTPSPIPERIRTPEADEAIGALVKTEEGAGVIPYFGTVALFQVPGRQYPVEVYHSAEPVPDFLEAALKTVFQIHRSEPVPGDILVFLTGQEEIDTLQKSIQEYAEGMDKSLPKVCITASHSQNNF